MGGAPEIWSQSGVVTDKSGSKFPDAGQPCLHAASASYLIHTAFDVVFLAHPLFLFGHRRVSAGAGGALLFPQGPSARNLSKPGRTILQQHNLGVLETHDSNLQWYAAPWQSQAKARSESSLVPGFFPPLVLVLVGLRRVSLRSQDLKPPYPIFAWGSNCHFSNQIDPPSLSAPSSITTNSIPQPFQSSTRLLPTPRHNCRSLQ